MNSALRRVLPAAIAIAVVGGDAAAQTRTPAEATFRQDTFTPAPTDRIRGDEWGGYRDDGAADPDCVIAWVDKGGAFFLRTVRPNCVPVAGGRAIWLDFSDPVSAPATCSLTDRYGNALNVCGAQVAADVRIIAHSLFKDSALTSGTTVVMPFSLQADFSGTGFELEFELPIPVTAWSPSTRVLDASPTAVAELYQYVKQGRKTVKVSVGRFRMPFQLAISRP